MKKLSLVLALGLSPTMAVAQHSADCNMVAVYMEVAHRAVASIADYQQLEKDFTTINAQHTERVRKIPPSMAIPVTPQNFSAKAADLQSVALARVARMTCETP